jgi:hypothetical protein
LFVDAQWFHGGSEHGVLGIEPSMALTCNKTQTKTKYSVLGTPSTMAMFSASHWFMFRAKGCYFVCSVFFPPPPSLCFLTVSSAGPLFHTHPNPTLILPPQAQTLPPTSAGQDLVSSEPCAALPGILVGEGVGSSEPQFLCWQNGGANPPTSENPDRTGTMKAADPRVTLAGC